MTSSTSPPAANLHPHDFTWYIASQGTYFLNMGVGMVFMPWLVLFYLETPAKLYGIYQATVMVPMLILMLFGGAKADRVDLRSWLIRLHTFQALAPFALSFMLYGEYLTYGLLMVYAICMSSLNGFVSPARDSMLSHASRGKDGSAEMQYLLFS